MLLHLWRRKKDSRIKKKSKHKLLTLKQTNKLIGIVRKTRTQERKIKIFPHVEASALSVSSAEIVIKRVEKESRVKKYMRVTLNKVDRVLFFIEIGSDNDLSVKLKELLMCAWKRLAMDLFESPFGGRGVNEGGYLEVKLLPHTI